ncbi:MAG: DUF1054 family protein [Firmicutes bacterium]|nr:DUF1054 family protein [Bacillota bacterium]
MAIAMVDFPTFGDEDFDVFAVPGLAPRMERLKAQVRPKLTQIGEHVAPRLSAAVGMQITPHVARHARRTVNPPADSWVAFAHDPRGYKKWPMFMIGLWQTHLFAACGVIYESPYRAAFAEAVLAHRAQLAEILPDRLRVIADHMRPESERYADVGAVRIGEMVERLTTRKHADLLFGVHVPREQATRMDGRELACALADACIALAPLYRATMSAIGVGEQ